MHWDNGWTVDDVWNNYYVLETIDPEDVEQLVKDAKMLKSTLEVLKNDYPNVYADLVLKKII